MDTERRLAEIESAASKLELGDEESLGELRRRLLDLTLLEHVRDLNPQAFTVLYLAKNLLRDLWTDVGTDASFGFPQPSNETDNEYELVTEFSQALGAFISIGLRPTGEVDVRLFDNVAKAVFAYYRLLDMIDSKAKRAAIPTA